jgi:uncharacterized iron-regulated protein
LTSLVAEALESEVAVLGAAHTSVPGVAAKWLLFKQLTSTRLLGATVPQLERIATDEQWRLYEYERTLTEAKYGLISDQVAQIVVEMRRRSEQEPIAWYFLLLNGQPVGGRRRALLS